MKRFGISKIKKIINQDNPREVPNLNDALFKHFQKWYPEFVEVKHPNILAAETQGGAGENSSI